MSDNTPAPSRYEPAYWVSLVLASLAVVLALAPLRFESPVVGPVAVAASVTDTAPKRKRPLTAQYTLGSFTYRCSECHRSVPVARTAGHGLTKHTEINLAHGINTRCLNCHHPVNREVFVDDYGREIPWDEPQFLCAKCHGPVFRDWQRGSHGRINGYWDVSRGAQVRLKCTQCHDPHHPPFPPLASAPGPHTLRVTPHAGGSHSEIRNPLRVTGTDPVLPPVPRFQGYMNDEQ